MKNFLLTGGSGVLGTEIKKTLQCEAPSSKVLNIKDMKTLYRYKFTKYTAVIHCAAYTDVPGCEKNKLLANEINIAGTRNVAEALKNNRIIYISTDYVYAGTNGNYSELDATKPFNYYGFTKLAGEQYMDPNKDLIIRTSFKPNTEWKHKIAFNDLYTSADYVDIIAQEIIRLADSDVVGIINVGTERKSIFDLVKRKQENIIAGSVKSVYNVSMPTDISLNIDKLNNIKRDKKWI